jgi:hypothetical protein
MSEMLKPKRDKVPTAFGEHAIGREWPGCRGFQGFNRLAERLFLKQVLQGLSIESFSPNCIT